MDFRDFFYVVEESAKLPRGRVLSRMVMGEWLAVFRDEEGRPRALRDRCLHRSAQLSRGHVAGGRLTCPYHGWTYDGGGRVVHIPSLGPEQKKLGNRCAVSYPTREKDGYVYVRLNPEPAEEIEPFDMPSYGKAGYHTIRLQNRFENDVTNCAENFVDIPHTAFVHDKIFRSSKNERLTATVVREKGSVVTTYHGEGKNLGIFGRILNPAGGELTHVDRFFMPNVTSVEYKTPHGWHFFITSQSVPVTDDQTLVYTDLTYDYGLVTKLAAPIVKRHGQAIIDQDLVILENQRKTMKKYGEPFSNAPADVIHVFIESIRGELAKGKDPRSLPPRREEIEFWV
jgi:phenylpropionate dioxygenase-like ring-hydroxylating dioxygenase large terminal subunit